MDPERGSKYQQYGNQHAAHTEDDMTGEGTGVGSDGDQMTRVGRAASIDQQDGDEI